jgi:hypothetical protein
VIERLLAAERALDADQLEVAHRLFSQVAGADPRNAIALTGLAKVAVRRGDLATARLHVTHALAIDPEDAAAKALAPELGVSVVAAPAAVAPTPDAASDPNPALASAPPKPKPGPAPSASRRGPARQTGSGHSTTPSTPASKSRKPKRGLLSRLWRAFLSED